MPIQSVPSLDLEQGLDPVVVHRRRVAGVEDREAHAVETDQAFLRAQPEIAVASLEDRRDGVLREARIAGPHVVAVLRQGHRRIEAEDLAGGERQQHRESQAGPNHTPEKPEKPPARNGRRIVRIGSGTNQGKFGTVRGLPGGARGGSGRERDDDVSGLPAPHPLLARRLALHHALDAGVQRTVLAQPVEDARREVVLLVLEDDATLRALDRAERRGRRGPAGSRSRSRPSGTASIRKNSRRRCGRSSTSRCSPRSVPPFADVQTSSVSVPSCEPAHRPLNQESVATSVGGGGGASTRPSAKRALSIESS